MPVRGTDRVRNIVVALLGFYAEEDHHLDCWDSADDLMAKHTTRWLNGAR